MYVFRNYTEMNLKALVKKNSRKITKFTKITTHKMNSFIIVKEIESVVTNKFK